jgi:hypothetical protein
MDMRSREQYLDALREEFGARERYVLTVFCYECNLGQPQNGPLD